MKKNQLQQKKQKNKRHENGPLIGSVFKCSKCLILTRARKITDISIEHPY